jgi:hypothetical protein
VRPLRRIDDRGDVITFDPPQEDVLTLCCNLSREFLASLRAFLTRERGNIPTPIEEDFKRSLAASLESSCVPDYAKEMTRANRAEIEASMAGATIDVVGRALRAITSVESDLASASDPLAVGRQRPTGGHPNLLPRGRVSANSVATSPHPDECETRSGHLRGPSVRA